MRNAQSAGVLARVSAPSSLVRESDKERERGRERVRKRERMRNA